MLALFSLFNLRFFIIVLISLSFDFRRQFFVIHFFHHYLRNWKDIFHRRIYLFFFLSEPIFMLTRRCVLRLGSNTSIGQRPISKLFFHYFFVYFSLGPFCFRINRRPIIMILKPKKLWPQQFLFILKISKQFMWSVLILIISR